MFFIILTASEQEAMLGSERPDMKQFPGSRSDNRDVFGQRVHSEPPLSLPGLVQGGDQR
jgi:hypothetical protein